MESFPTDIGNECLVTDLVNELSSGLEIPFLLGDNISLSDKQDGTIYNEFLREKNFLNDALNTEIFESEINYCIKNKSDYNLSFHHQDVTTNYHFMNDLLKSNNESGSGSNSECSSVETWMVKNELDTPPVTPPDERISIDNNFLVSNEELAFIPIAGGDKLLKNLNNVKNNVSSALNIQQKLPSDAVNIFDSQNLKSINLQSTIFFNGLDDIKSNSFKSDLDANTLLTLHEEKKKAVLSRKDLELQAKKKQERMIRNRESAYLSRKRKKEYVAHLERQVKDLIAENSNLRLENYSLKQRLANFEKINISAIKKPKNLFSNSPKKATALFALFLTFCFNFGSFSSLMNEVRWNEDKIPEGQVIEIQSNKIRHTRSLLWTDSELKVINSTLMNLTTSSCPAFINQSESIRLESELRKWIKGENDYSGSNSFNISKLSQYFYTKDIPQLKNDFSKVKKRKKSFSFKKGYLEMDMYKVRPNFFNFDTFFEAIHRRDDTFYLVSFSGDHLLLPALSHNQTSRPKISLMLPALLSNVTKPTSDQVEMMQIDCEVTNTQVLSVNENDIPFYMKSFSNFTPKIKEKYEQKQGKYENYLINNQANLLSLKQNLLEPKTYSKPTNFNLKTIKKSVLKFSLAKFMKYQSSAYTFNSINGAN